MPSAAQARRADIKAVLDTRPVQFRIKSGGKTWACTVHSDRASYERTKAMRKGSADSITSSSGYASSK